MTDTRQGKGGLGIRQNEHSLVDFSVQWTYASKKTFIIYKLISHVTDEFQSNANQKCDDDRIHLLISICL